MSYKHRNASSHRKKSTDKGLLKKQSSVAEDNRSDSEKKMESIELKETSCVMEKQNSKDSNIEETTSLNFLKVDAKKSGEFCSALSRFFFHFSSSFLQFL